MSQVHVNDNLIGLEVNKGGNLVVLTELMDTRYTISFIVTVLFCISLISFATYFMVNEIR